MKRKLRIGDVRLLEVMSMENMSKNIVFLIGREFIIHTDAANYGLNKKGAAEFFSDPSRDCAMQIGIGDRLIFIYKGRHYDVESRLRNQCGVSLIVKPFMRRGIKMIGSPELKLRLKETIGIALN
jgi:hypothetical protein